MPACKEDDDSKAVTILRCIRWISLPAQESGLQEGDVGSFQQIPGEAKDPWI
ncbi:MAG: hypothetical protein ACLUD0_20320 [Eubacterium ramulus]